MSSDEEEKEIKRLTEEARRYIIMRYVVDRKQIPDVFTCDSCGEAHICSNAFDLENVNDRCIVEEGR